MKSCVLDTNVVVSGFLKPNGPPARLLDWFFANRLRLVYDRRMLVEYGDVLARPELGIAANDRSGFLLLLNCSGERIENPPPIRLTLPDADDVPFIETALASAEKIVVTKNLVHFQPAMSLGLRILSPAEAVAELEWL